MSVKVRLVWAAPPSNLVYTLDSSISGSRLQSNQLDKLIIKAIIPPAV